MDAKRSYSITLDDDPVMHKIIAQMTGVSSLPFTCPDKLLARAASFDPLGIFVDIHLDVGVSGLDYLARFRAAWPYTPILVVTDDPTQKLIGEALALGANDFVRKPLQREELVARLSARVHEMKERRDREQLCIGKVTFDKNLRRLRCGDKEAFLGGLEARLFATLAPSFGMRIAKDELRGALWGSTAVSANALDQQISGLRRALREIGADFSVHSAYGGGVCLQRLAAVA